MAGDTKKLQPIIVKKVKKGVIGGEAGAEDADSEGATL